MNIELLITIAAAIVLANLINKTVVNPLLNKIFGGNQVPHSHPSSRNHVRRKKDHAVQN